MKIAVNNLQTKIPIPHSRIQTAVIQACKLLRLKKEISLVFVAPRRMQGLNKRFLGHDYVTDVITFDLGDCAEIIICPVMALTHAKVYSQGVNKEILLYVLHGLLHVAGYDDKRKSDIKRMRLKEKKLLHMIL